MISRLLLFISCLVLALACKQAGEQYDKSYFDFDSLIRAQQAVLLKKPATITKTVMLDGKQDHTTLKVDSILIANELDVFRQLDLINKPLYAQAYQISDGEKDSHSNLMKREYRARQPAPIPYVTFYYQEKFTQLRRIVSHYSETNSLYSTERKLVLEFEDSSGTLLLSRYHLAGSQKMMLNDSVHFSIEGLLH